MKLRTNLVVPLSLMNGTPNDTDGVPVERHRCPQCSATMQYDPTTNTILHALPFCSLFEAFMREHNPSEVTVGKMGSHGRYVEVTKVRPEDILKPVN